MTRYPLAPQGVFETIQGEGVLLGEPMIFVRLAGCSVGCSKCDTDYSVASRATANEIAAMVVNAARLPPPPGQRPAEDVRSAERWVWLTGGEPCDHDLTELVEALHVVGYRVSLATSGQANDHAGWGLWPFGVDWVSVSPHDPQKLRWKNGHQLNVVPHLKGFDLKDFERYGLHDWSKGFPEKFVTPCDGVRESVVECAAFVRRNPGWRLGVQAHKVWGLP